MSATTHGIRFPNETAEYRESRDRLLAAEVDLRRQHEAVNEQRRALPLGGEIPQDYVFEEGSSDLAVEDATKSVRLSELFAADKESLLIYSYMFGPAMKAPCVSCTSILDGLNGSAPHIMQRVNLAVVAKSPLPRIREVARERGWKNLRLLSSASNSYNTDYHAENESGGQLPSLTVFVRRDGKVYHSYSTELLYTTPPAGMDGRHVDSIWPVWNAFDFAPEGRGVNWYPKLKY